ncbi:MAG: hypothetical protein Q9183_004290 [Haloplaca sp. 2 TL-2023]
MHGDIVDVRAETIIDENPYTLLFRSLTEMLLFIDNEVFRASNDTGCLYALNRLSNHDTTECRVWTRRGVSSWVRQHGFNLKDDKPEAFPVTPTFCQDAYHISPQEASPANTGPEGPVVGRSQSRQRSVHFAI